MEKSGRATTDAALGPPDSESVTIRHIAQRAGVSVATVSRVLNDTVPVKHAKRVAEMDAVEALGYRPNVVARELVRGHTRALGILLQGISNPFYSQLLTGVSEGLRASPYYPLFAIGEQAAEQTAALDLLLTHRIAALVLKAGHIPDQHILALANGLPVVTIGRTIRGMESRCLRVDNREGAYKATKHLRDLGHERIVHITGLHWHADAVARLEGYEGALRDTGIAIDRALIVEGDFEERSGLDVTERLLDARVAFTAIFAGNDQMAYGARLALFQRGLRVPGDVSIVGFDDHPGAAYACPPLTTIRQPAVEMGIATARALLDELAGRGFVQPTFHTDLVLRASTASPRTSAGRSAVGGHRKSGEAERSAM